MPINKSHLTKNDDSCDERASSACYLSFECEIENEIDPKHLHHRYPSFSIRPQRLSQSPKWSQKWLVHLIWEKWNGIQSITIKYQMNQMKNCTKSIETRKWAAWSRPTWMWFISLAHEMRQTSHLPTTKFTWFSFSTWIHRNTHTHTHFFDHNNGSINLSVIV